MKKIIKISKYIFFGIIIAFFAQSCALLNRTESDLYTITKKDSVYVRNTISKEEIDNKGVLAPLESREIHERTTIKRDSIANRHFPAFIRAGLFESVGIVTGSSEGIGTGLFGLFPDIKKISLEYRGEKGKIFAGGIYRLGVLDYRLRWFEDSPNWTIGTIAAEYILPNSKAEEFLIANFPIYIKKKFYLRETLPYLCITASGGLGLYPSRYVNLSGSLDFGSYGGLTLRTYLGIVMGYNSTSTTQIANNDFTNEAQTVIKPYFGLGVGVFDFTNTVEEYKTEWKNHKHSVKNAGILAIGMNMLNSNNNANVFTGFSVEIAKTHIILPVLNNKFTLGTSLLNMMVFTENNQAYVGLLPVELSYWQNIVKNSLYLRPFIKFNYYPSLVGESGLALNIRMSEMFTLTAKLEYIIGNPGGYDNKLIPEFLNLNNDISCLLLNLSFGLGDRIMLPNEIRF